MMSRMLKRAYIFAAVAIASAGWAGTAWAGGGARGGSASRAATVPAGGATRAGTIPASGTGVAPAGTVVKGNASIQLPRGWTEMGGPNSIMAQPPGADRDATGQVQAVLSLSQDVGNKVDGAAQQAEIKKGLPGYVVMEEPTPLMVGGLSGVKFGGSFKRGTVELRSEQYMFAANNQVFTITFTCLNSKWAAYQGVVEGSVGTFGVKK